MNLANGSYTSMGRPIKAPCLIPVEHRATPACINKPFMVEGKAYEVTCVSFGTPHGAVFVENIDAVDMTGLGASLSEHRLFPKGASIVFVQQLSPERIRARLWQRGKGEYPLTPEAACVALTASKMLRRAGREADVLADGGKFHVKWDSSDDNVYFQGPIKSQ